MRIRPLLTAVVCALGMSVVPGLGAVASPDPPDAPTADPVVQAPTLQDGDLDFTVQRLAGANRYETAVQISREFTSPGVPVVYVAAGGDFPDALSAGPAAARRGTSVLFVQESSIPADVLAEIDRLNPSRIMLIGGPIAVSETAAAQLRTVATTERVAGGDRYGTAVAVSRRVFGPGRPAVTVATGTAFSDALAGVPAARTTRGPIMLARASSLPYSSELDRLSPGTAYLLGGRSVMSIDVDRAVQRERGVCWSGPTVLGGSQQVLSTVPGTTSKKVAFTLDMGGNLTGATDIVDFLVEHQVCTTFFPTSIMADTTEGRRVMARIAAHPELFEVGNHTIHHCDLVSGGGGSPSGAPCQVPMTQTFVRHELSGAQPVLERLAGMEIRPLWRPPYGSHNAWVRDQAAAVGYPVTVYWARDTIDWDPATTTAQIVARTTTPLPPSGAIVLAHLGGFRTGDALPQIVEILRANGYTMTTVSDLRDG